MFITPGTWDVIPVGATVRAVRKGTTIEGTLIGVMGANDAKFMDINAFPPATTTIYARDHWEVTYDVPTLQEKVLAADIGTRFRKADREYIRLTTYWAACIDHDKRWNVKDYRPELVRIDSLGENISFNGWRVVEPGKD